MLKIAIISKFETDFNQIITSYCIRKNINYEIYVWENIKEYKEIELYFDIVYMDAHYFQKTVQVPYVIAFINTASFPDKLSILQCPIVCEEVENQLDYILNKLHFRINPEYLYFQENKSSISITPKEIFYFEYIERRVRIVTVLKIYYVHCCLRDLKKALQSFGFASPHKAFLINQYLIKQISHEGIYMGNGDLIPMAKRNASKFKVDYETFRKNYMRQINV